MKRLTLSVMLVVAVVANTFACTNLIVGKNVSTDGSTIVSYSADSYGLFGELYHYPAGMHKKGTLIDVHEWDTGKYLGQIEQARQTYNVIGNMNEFQLTIGETTFGGRPELVDTTGIIDYGSLIYLGLQRSRTAREAIKVMTDLVQEYGYYSSGESFTIADPNEIWIMEMIGKGPGVRGAVWVAVRVPDDCISAHANQSRIHQFDMNDKNNCMYSPDVISFAREKGYFDGVNKDFSFANAYAPLDFGARRYCEARVWSYFNMFTARGNEFLPYILGDTDTPMPLFVKPNRKISVQDVKNAMRDHYEGTPLDISRDFGAGPYHTPYRLSPLSFKVGDKEYFNERPISTQQSGFVFVAQMRSTLPDAIGGVLWFGTDDANMTVFTPVYCCTDKVPVCYSRVDGADYITFSWNSSFWIFTCNLQYVKCLLHSKLHILHEFFHCISASSRFSTSFAPCFSYFFSLVTILFNCLTHCLTSLLCILIMLHAVCQLGVLHLFRVCLVKILHKLTNLIITLIVSIHFKILHLLFSSVLIADHECPKHEQTSEECPDQE